MASEMFLRLDDVTGESKDETHGGEMEILSWSWGATQPGTIQSGTGGGSGKVQIHDLSIVKYVDLASPTLLDFMCRHVHPASGQLTSRKHGGSALEFEILKMEKIVVTSLSKGGVGEADRPTESLTLQFAKFDYKYTAQNDDGSAGTEIEISYDIQSGSSA